MLGLVVQSANCRSAKTNFHRNSVLDQWSGFTNNKTVKEEGRGLFFTGKIDKYYDKVNSSYRFQI